jgi:hypothetical protein
MGVRRMELVEPSPPMIESGREWKKVNRKIWMEVQEIRVTN